MLLETCLVFFKFTKICERYFGFQTSNICKIILQTTSVDFNISSFFTISFTVNLQCGPNTNPRDDLALHLNARIHERVVVRNSRISGVWGQEERHGMFPFVPEQRFEILLLAESNNYKVN